MGALDILTAIDDAIEATRPTCVRCGIPLPARCPSGWWCSEQCQQAWTARNADPLPTPGSINLPGVRSQDAGEAMRRVVREIAELYRLMWGEINAALARTAAALHASTAGTALDDQAPTDPRGRALWLRQHRNTGPKPRRQHPPRTIHPRRTR